jgi:hypothetical protein
MDGGARLSNGGRLASGLASRQRLLRALGDQLALVLRHGDHHAQHQGIGFRDVQRLELDARLLV